MSKAKGDENGNLATPGGGDSFNLRTLFVGGSAGHKLDRKAVARLGGEYPLIATILGGSEATSDTPEVEPASITFFVREGKIRFSANVKSADTTIIGEVSDALSPWESIEYALRAGQVSSKRYSDRKTTSPDQEKLLY